MYGNKLVNTIKTKQLCASSSNLADMSTMVRGWTLLILEVTGQSWRSGWASLTNVGCTGMLYFALLYYKIGWFEITWCAVNLQIKFLDGYINICKWNNLFQICHFMSKFQDAQTFWEYCVSWNVDKSASSHIPSYSENLQESLCKWKKFYQ